MTLPRPLLLLAPLLGCRDFHEPLPIEECQPYDLICIDCTFEEDAGDDRALLRVYGCELPDGYRLDAVTRVSIDVPATDTHYYSAVTGLRVAALRRHDEPIQVCDTRTDEEWWGDIFTCTPVCEHERLPDSDPDLPDC